MTQTEQAAVYRLIDLLGIYRVHCTYLTDKQQAKLAEDLDSRMIDPDEYIRQAAELAAR